MNKALFLDRDGVMIKEKHLMTSMAQVELIPSAAHLIAKFKKAGFLIFVVTNQTVVARGMLTLAEAESLNQKILAGLIDINPEAKVDKSYICPHHPKAEILEYRINCKCRKPKSGMLESAQTEYQLNLLKCVLIGDRLTDIYAARSVGVKAILLSSEINDQKLIESDLKLNPEFLKPDLVISSLDEVNPS